jgi:hypothetical protein
MHADHLPGNIRVEASPLFITKKALAERYSVSTRTIQTWVTRRIIPFVRMSGGQGRGLLRFNPKACDAALNQFGGVKELPITMTRPWRKRLIKPVPRPRRTDTHRAASKRA